MIKGLVLQVCDTKSSTVKKGLDKQNIIFKVLESPWPYFHNTLIKLALWLACCFPKANIQLQQ